MKRFAMAVALTGLLSVTALAGNIPTGDVVSPPAPPATTSATSSTSNTLLAQVVLTVITLIGR